MNPREERVILRYFELERIKDEVYSEIASEIWNEILQKDFPFEFKFSNPQLFFIFLTLFAFLISYVMLVMWDIELMNYIIELPHLKPVIIVTIPAFFGILARKNEKNNKKKC